MAVVQADEEDEAAGELAAEEDGVSAAPGDETDVVLSPEDVIMDLKKKIDWLGPVNMMAIEQFDELETRHTFLTARRRTCSIRSR